ncbi:heterokaryon incompatibility -domain-containing [Fusarium longipes]|uniref:Heterokaryon incompatibility-domain-containing n=1 Tax=Fusarium longipes TaxID=694270 RepID=A0A395T5U1_9HYPO|nr:heterokaryon incompatibility -domain-containing [Fusarium longipes]
MRSSSIRAIFQKLLAPPTGQRCTPRRIAINSMVEHCGYCQLLKSCVFQLTKSHPSVLLLFFEKSEGWLRVSGSDYKNKLWDFVIYTPNKSRLIPHLNGRGPRLGSCHLDNSVSFINKQLSTCPVQHESCKSRASPLPTRVIYIGSSSSGVRLVDSKGMVEKYIALSHCWGGEQPMRTTSTNLVDMKNNIALENMPIVFQQAISVARKLGVNYIWIDSLCIIQDSQSDWELESSQMCYYYENAHLTIATATSPTPNVPFLDHWDSKWDPIELQLVTRRGSEPLLAQRIPDTTQDEGVLFTRGWTMQESAMSSRTIYFTPTGLIWECIQHVVPHRFASTKLELERLGFSRALHQLRSGLTDGRDEIWAGWEKFVTWYSRRELTFPGDKLPALSGIASRVYEITKSRYLAGIWQDSLPSSLFWVRSINQGSTVPLPDVYVAPSWSWASTFCVVEVPIYRNFQKIESAITILETECHVPGLNPFGRVSNGHIKLRGQIGEAVLTCERSYPDTRYKISGPEGRWYLEVDSTLISTDGVVSRAKRGQTVSDFSTKVHYLYLGSTISTWKHEVGDRMEHYIMVLGRSKDKDGCYCRLGMATLRNDFPFERNEDLCREITIV